MRRNVSLLESLSDPIAHSWGRGRELPGALLPRPSAALTHGPDPTAGSGNVKGNWSEAITSLSEDCYGFVVTIVNNSTIKDFLYDIGIGAGGAEVVVVENLLFSNINAGVSGSSFLVPIYIPRGTRVAARCQASTGSASNQFRLTPLYANPFALKYRSSETWGAATADSGGTSIDPGGTINTKGAWTQLTASTSRRTRMLLVLNGNQLNSVRTTAQWRCDIGVGGAGSEVAVLTDLPCQMHTSNDIISPMCWGPFACDIPAGSRISARAICEINDATDRLADLVVYGFSDDAA